MKYMRPFLDLNRPTDQISLAHYTALTLTGAFFSRYALLVVPVNYTLCSVNIASTRGVVVFGSAFSIVCLLLLLGHTHCCGLERLKSRSTYTISQFCFAETRARGAPSPNFTRRDFF